MFARNLPNCKRFISQIGALCFVCVRKPESVCCVNSAIQSAEITCNFGTLFCLLSYNVLKLLNYGPKQQKKWWIIWTFTCRSTWGLPLQHRSSQVKSFEVIVLELAYFSRVQSEYLSIINQISKYRLTINMSYSKWADASEGLPRKRVQEQRVRLGEKRLNERVRRLTTQQHICTVCDESPMKKVTELI